jgi:hypothetical protein
MKLKFDHAQERRQDNSQIVQVLTTVASCLNDHERLSLKEIHDFRISMVGAQKATEWGQQSILVGLAKENNSFLTQLMQRYGLRGLCLNIFRYSAGAAVSQTIGILSEIGAALIEQTKVYFNRPFYLHFDGSCERRILSSQIILDLADFFGVATQTLTQAVNQMKTLVPADLFFEDPVDKIIDDKIATMVGFSHSTPEYLPFKRERDLRLAFSATMQNVGLTCLEFIEQIKCNLDAPYHDLRVSCEILAAETAKFSSLPLELSDDLQLWEERRYNLKESIVQINHVLENLGAALVKSLSLMSKASARENIPNSLLRNVSSTLIYQGAHPVQAALAAKQLSDYCVAHALTPDKVIESELKKINPLLNKESLATFQKANIGKGLDESGAEFKEQLLKKSSVLSELFSKALQANQTWLAILLTIFLSSCGLKTAPRSDIDDFRPSIPFKAKQQKQPATPNQEEEPAKPNDSSK